MALNTESIAYIAEHMTKCKKHQTHRKKVWITCDSRESGEVISKLLHSVYPEAEIGNDSFGYKDFTLRFGTTGQRDNAVNEINNMVDGYRASNPGLIDATLATVDLGTQTSTSSGLKGKVIYIIVGAVVIVLALLLWKKKKK